MTTRLAAGNVFVAVSVVVEVNGIVFEVNGLVVEVAKNDIYL